MAKKVYALFYQEPKSNYLQQSKNYEIKIKSNKHWMNEANSRASLVKKAKEIQAGWIDKKKKEIAEIEAIVIK